MKVNTIRCKNLLTKSRLPEVEYCINPYVGCMHGCIYCYARFMRRFTNHPERWGEFVDVRINALEILERELSRHPKRGIVLLGSVTDVYQPIEHKYKITRALLETLLKYDFPISVLTKSNLVIRDIDLLRQFSDCEIGLTLTTLDEQEAKDFEPRSSSPQERIESLEMLHNAGIRTYGFLGPILPGITNLQMIFSVLKGKADFVMAESLNTKCGNRQNILNLLKTRYSHLLPLYQSGFHREYWDKVENELKILGRKFEIPLRGFFRH